MSKAWVQTYSGVKFPLFEFTSDDVKILDIAHALSMQCRFNGHIKRFYSVAEHCWLVSHIVPVEYALTGLLHDAPETYIGDMVSPLKREMFDFTRLDHSMMMDIFSIYGAPVDSHALNCVHAADTWIAHQEARALMMNPEIVDDWGPPPKFKPAMHFDFSEIGLAPERAKQLFLSRFEDLVRYQNHFRNLGAA